jgi:formylglycine-generating enzyme required for sulfatase activity
LDCGRGRRDNRAIGSSARITLIFWLGAAACAVPPSPPAIYPDKPADYVQEMPGPQKGKVVRFEMVGIPGGGAIRPFWIGKTEVTWAEYAAYAFPEHDEESLIPAWIDQAWAKFKGDDEEKWRLEEVDAVSRPSNPHEPPDAPWGMGRRPAIRMTSRSAREYCKWLSRVTGRAYRLPTEAEWETAAGRGPEAAALGEVAWFKDNSGGMTHEVGTKKPNAFGLHDMLGNVMEYVSDTVEPPRDLPWFDDKRPCGVLKGGCWDDPAEAVRIDRRQPELFKWNLRDPNRPKSIVWHYDGPMVGFRVARSVEEK